MLIPNIILWKSNVVSSGQYEANIKWKVCMVGFSCQDLSKLIVNSDVIHAQISIFTLVSDI